MMNINDVLLAAQYPHEYVSKNECVYVFSAGYRMLSPQQSAAFLTFMQQTEDIRVVDSNIFLFKCDYTDKLISLMSNEKRNKLYHAIKLGRVKSIIHKQLKDRFLKLEQKEKLC